MVTTFAMAVPENNTALVRATNFKVFIIFSPKVIYKLNINLYGLILISKNHKINSQIKEICDILMTFMF